VYPIFPKVTYSNLFFSSFRRTFFSLPSTTTPPPSQPPLRRHTWRVRRGHNSTWIAAKMVVKPGSVPDFEALRELFKHHIESFDHMVDAGLDTAIRHIKAVEVFDELTATKLRNILFLC